MKRIIGGANYHVDIAPLPGSWVGPAPWAVRVYRLGRELPGLAERAGSEAEACEAARRILDRVGAQREGLYWSR